jgi:ribonuclease E
MPVEKAGQVTNEVAEIFEIVSTETEITTNDVAGEQSKRNNSRRGPNRRRPRNPNYKKPETDGDSNSSNEQFSVSNDERSPIPAPIRSYDIDFAARVDRVEKAERQESEAQVSVPASVNIEKNIPEVHKPAPIVESVSTPVEATRPVEVVKPVEVARPVEVVRPVEAVKPVEVAIPVEAERPVEAVKPVEAARPVEVVKPVEAIRQESE